MVIEMIDDSSEVIVKRISFTRQNPIPITMLADSTKIMCGFPLNYYLKLTGAESSLSLYM